MSRVIVSSVTVSRVTVSSVTVSRVIVSRVTVSRVTVSTVTVRTLSTVLVSTDIFAGSNSTDIWQARADRVRSVISGAWSAYRKFGAGTDDLNPVSHSGTRWLYGEATFYDSLDTLWLAGHKEQFRQACVLPCYTGCSEGT